MAGIRWGWMLEGAETTAADERRVSVRPLRARVQAGGALCAICTALRGKSGTSDGLHPYSETEKTGTESLSNCGGWGQQTPFPTLSSVESSAPDFTRLASYSTGDW